MLHKLREMTGGNESRMEIYLSTINAEVPKYIELLTDAIEKTNLSEMQYVAHICKPLLTMIGLDEMYQLADHLEQHVKAKKENEQAVKMAKKLLKALKSLLDDLKSRS